MSKLHIEVWSDWVCPFCYIGKRHFEAALAQLPFASAIELKWKAYQLEPELQTAPDALFFSYFAQRKGMTEQQAREMMQNVTDRAAEIGLKFNMEKARVNNTLRAHQLAKFAAEHGRLERVSEMLFEAYFTNGQNLDDTNFLLQIAQEAGLDNRLFAQALNEQHYLADVKKDIEEAHLIGLTGVPFFVLNGRYAVSGAQPAAVFVQAITQVYEEWQTQRQSDLTSANGDSCSIAGCD